MSYMLKFRPRNAMLHLLMLWLIASAFYYIQNLFSPSFYMGYDQGTLHKGLKYVVCLGLSAYFCIAARAYGLMLFCALMLVLAAYLVMDSGSLELATLSIIVVGTMLPFILVPVLWKRRLLVIGRVMVACGAIVGIFSVIELTFLASLFGAVWASTSSIRSISTLFNPNNLGLYVGVSLVLLPYMRLRTFWRSLCGALLLFSLANSGSRTAWVALTVVFLYALIVSADARARLFAPLHRHLPLLLMTAFFLAVLYAFCLAYSKPPEVEVKVAYRGLNLYTASIRWDHFLAFLRLVDYGLLFPDVMGRRAGYVQDNFYLVALNSFGAVGILLFFVFFVTHFSIRRNSTPRLFPWQLVLVFYMVSGLSGSHLNSFPNNQLFFLSMGSMWIYRRGFRYAQAGHAGIPSHAAGRLVRLSRAASPIALSPPSKN